MQLYANMEWNTYNVAKVFAVMSVSYIWQSVVKISWRYPHIVQMRCRVAEETDLFDLFWDAASLDIHTISAQCVNTAEIFRRLTSNYINRFSELSHYGRSRKCTKFTFIYLSIADNSNVKNIAALCHCQILHCVIFLLLSYIAAGVFVAFFPPMLLFTKTAVLILKTISLVYAEKKHVHTCLKDSWK